MFKKTKTDIAQNQSVVRFADVHRDPVSRVKHLKILLDGLNVHEKRQLIDDYSFETFHLVDELLLQTEISGNPQAAIEAESGLWTLEQLLCLAPELIGNGWQRHAIESLLKKAIYPHNLLAVRKIAIRLFLIWYQELAVYGKSTPDLDRVFQCLLPYFPLRNGSNTEFILQEYCQSAGAVQWSTPSLAGKSPSLTGSPNLTAKERAQMLQVYLDKFLEYCTRETTKIEWHDENRRLDCAKFILDKVITLYIHETFPDLETNGVDVFGGWEGAGEASETLDTADPVVIARYWLIRWINNVAGSPISMNSGIVHHSLLLYHKALFSCNKATNTLLSLQREAMQLPLPCSNVIQKVVAVLASWLTQTEIPPFVANGAVNADSCSLLLLHLLLSFFHSPYLKQPGDRVQHATSTAFSILKACRDLVCQTQLPRSLSTRVWNELIARLCDAGLVICSSADRFAQETAAAFATTILTSVVFIRAIRNIEVEEKLWDQVHTVFTRGIWMPIATQWSKVVNSVTRALILEATQIDIFSKEDKERAQAAASQSARRGPRSEISFRSGTTETVSLTTDDASGSVGDDSAEDTVFLDTDDITLAVQSSNGALLRWIIVWKRLICLVGPHSKGAAVVAVDTIGQTIQSLINVGLYPLAHWLCTRLLSAPPSVLPQCVVSLAAVLAESQPPITLQAHILSAFMCLLTTADSSVVSQMPAMGSRHLSILSPHLLSSLPRLAHAPSNDLLKVLALLCPDHSAAESLLLRNLAQADLPFPLCLLCINALSLLVNQRADIDLMLRVVECLQSHRFFARLLPVFCSSITPLSKFGMSSAVVDTLITCAGLLREERMRTEVEWQLVGLCLEGKRREAANVFRGILADRQQVLEGAMIQASGQWPLPGFSASKWNSADNTSSTNTSIAPQDVAFINRRNAIVSVCKLGNCEMTCRTPAGKHIWAVDEYEIERKSTSTVSDWLKREAKKNRRTGRDSGGILGAMDDPFDALLSRKLPKSTNSKDFDVNSWAEIIQTSKKPAQPVTIVPTPAPNRPAPYLREWRAFAATMGFVPAVSEVPNNFGRDLRHLDSTGTREVHKFALIYVPPGVMDKNVILTCTKSSSEFDQFANELGWEVQMGKNHEGYTGGLPADTVANYWANSDTEIVYHVSTKLGGDATYKVRHLGNDEVHIVFNENCRQYRRDVIATKFCDVLIVVESAGDSCYRVRIETQISLDFGPLFDGAFVGRNELAALVRATAVNASRAYRLARDDHARPLRHREAVFSTETKRHLKPMHLSDAIDSLYVPTLVA